MPDHSTTLPPLIDRDGEARELNDADFERLRPWQPGDPVSHVPVDVQQAEMLRFKTAALRSEAEVLEAEAKRLGRG